MKPSEPPDRLLELRISTLSSAESLLISYCIVGAPLHYSYGRGRICVWIGIAEAQRVWLGSLTSTPNCSRLLF